MTSAFEFKKKYPRFYRKIISYYQSHTKVFDKSAAIDLYLSGKIIPRCEICHKVLTVTKSLQLPYRCRSHVNTAYVDKARVASALESINKTIVAADENLILSSVIEIHCPEHGNYKQTVRYILNGGDCQKCYHAQRKPRIDFQQWKQDCDNAHHNKYSYHQETYNGTNHDAKISCPVHGDFWQNAGVHRRGHGCSQCAAQESAIRRQYTTQQFIEKASQIHHNKYTYDLTEYTGARSTVEITCEKHGAFSQVAYYHLAGNGCPDCGVEKTTNKSAAEYEIISWLDSHGITAIQSDRSFGSEIDIWCPEHDLAIEYNGVYWHSSGHKETDAKHRKQHLNKTQMCENNHAKLYHIWDLEWNNEYKQDIWKSMILHACAKTPVNIDARNCCVRIIDGTTAKDFLELHHIQGSCAGAKFNMALVTEDDQIVALMCLGKSRYNKNYQYELLRFCVKKYHNVRGGFSKLFNHFVKNQKPTSIISYGNRRWSRGDLYEKNNFVLADISEPCYYYTDCKTLWHRSKFQKHKLEKHLKLYDEQRSEAENMYENNYRRLWDCGQYAYVWRDDDE